MCVCVRPRAYRRVKHLKAASLLGRLLPLPTDIRPSWKGMSGANTLAYFEITASKSFIKSVPGVRDTLLCFRRILAEAQPSVAPSQQEVWKRWNMCNTFHLPEWTWGELIIYFCIYFTTDKSLIWCCLKLIPVYNGLWVTAPAPRHSD